MTLLQKLSKFIFSEEEEEEIIEEGELEEITFSNTPSYQEKPTVNYTSSAYEKVDVHTNHQEPSKQEESTFKSIDLDKELPASTKITVSSPKSTIQPKLSVKETIRQEYEFTPVISPMFGSEESKVKKQTITNVPHTRSTNSKVAKKPSLATVISPMYGASEDIELEKEIEEVDSKIENKQVDISATKEIETNFNLNQEEKTCEKESLDLEKENNLEDVLQISLFGKDEVIHAQEDVDAYTIDE